MDTAYVATCGTSPTHSAYLLVDAQKAAQDRETRFLDPDHYEFRWDEYLPGEVWRLMSRPKNRKGRFSWTQRAVHAVEHVTA